MKKAFLALAILAFSSTALFAQQPAPQQTTPDQANEAPYLRFPTIPPSTS
ncbi:hypothetical protein ACQ86N_35900 [Puia sp. P3]